MRNLRAPDLEFMDRDDILCYFMRNKYADRTAIVITNGIEAFQQLPIFIVMKRDNYELWARAQEKNYIIRTFPSAKAARAWTYNFPPEKNILWELWEGGFLVERSAR